MSRAGRIAAALGGAAFLAAVVVLVVSTVSTSSATLTASTSGSGTLSAAAVDIDRASDSVEVSFNADGLGPGVAVPGCIAFDYQGSVPAAVRLHAAVEGGTRLESYVDIRLTTRSVGTCDDGTASEGARGQARVVYDGRLSDLVAAHPSFGDGLRLPGMASGDRLVLESTASLVDDNEAQGLTTVFTMTVEARP